MGRKAMRVLLYKDEVFQLVGAAMEVHSQLGCGFLEPVYQEALSMEFALRKIPFVAQPQLAILYKGAQLSKYYIPDFIAYEKIIIEIKALNELTVNEDAQILNYLKVSRCEVGLLINFGTASLDWHRRVLSKEVDNII
jgi:GxxExxY protein